MDFSHYLQALWASELSGLHREQGQTFGFVPTGRRDKLEIPFSLYSRELRHRRCCCRRHCRRCHRHRRRHHHRCHHHHLFKLTWYSATCCCGVNADGIIGCGLTTGCCWIGCTGGAGLWIGWWTSGWTCGAGLGGGCGLVRTLGWGLELMGGGLVVLLSIRSCTGGSELGGTSWKCQNKIHFLNNLLVKLITN